MEGLSCARGWVVVAALLGVLPVRAAFVEDTLHVALERLFGAGR